MLLFGADAQKHISDFSESALQAVRTSDTGEVGKMLENLVVELKGFEADAEELDLYIRRTGIRGSLLTKPLTRATQSEGAERARAAVRAE